MCCLFVFEHWCCSALTCCQCRRTSHRSPPDYGKPTNRRLRRARDCTYLISAVVTKPGPTAKERYCRCKVMMVFFKIWPEKFKKPIITLQVLRFKLKCLNQTCLSLKSIMLLSPDSASFIEKKRVENRLWRKSEFLWRKKNISFPGFRLGVQRFRVQSFKVQGAGFEGSMFRGSGYRVQSSRGQGSELQG